MNDLVHEETAGGIPLEFPKVIGRYTYVRTLGSGSSCVAVEVINCSTDEHLACKVVSRVALTEAGEFGYFEQELRVHEFLNHPNIVKIHEVLFQPDLVFVILDLCAGGDLLAFIIDHPGAYPTVYRPMIIQILRALDYLHSRGIAHRDIKPDNILLTSTNEIKIADFGCCEVTTFGAEPKASGTVYYAAPEIFLDSPTVGIKSDIWSFGVLLFTMFSGHLPWQDGDKDAIVEQIVHRKFSSAFVMPRDLRNIFDQCTRLDPKTRPTAAELLQDSWLQMEPAKRQCSGTSSQILSSTSSLQGFVPVKPVARRVSVVESGPAEKKKRLKHQSLRIKVRPVTSAPTIQSFQFGPNKEV
jgi:serine/threonine protein kinase